MPTAYQGQKAFFTPAFVRCSKGHTFKARDEYGFVSGSKKVTAAIKAGVPQICPHCHEVVDFERDKNTPSVVLGKPVGFRTLS